MRCVSSCVFYSWTHAAIIPVATERGSNGGREEGWEEERVGAITDAGDDRRWQLLIGIHWREIDSGVGRSKSLKHWREFIIKTMFVDVPINVAVNNNNDKDGHDYASECHWCLWFWPSSSSLSSALSSSLSSPLYSSIKQRCHICKCDDDVDDDDHDDDVGVVDLMNISATATTVMMMTTMTMIVIMTLWLISMAIMTTTVMVMTSFCTQLSPTTTKISHSWHFRVDWLEILKTFNFSTFF